jgi:hypothetical protein
VQGPADGSLQIGAAGPRLGEVDDNLDVQCRDLPQERRSVGRERHALDTRAARGSDGGDVVDDGAHGFDCGALGGADVTPAGISECCFGVSKNDPCSFTS